MGFLKIHKCNRENAFFETDQGFDLLKPLSEKLECNLAFLLIFGIISDPEKTEEIDVQFWGTLGCFLLLWQNS